MSPATEKLPPYLRKYIAKQRYEAYTSRDHAAWRYIMRQNVAFFSEHAVPMYLKGLEKTGISIDRIPRVSEMDDCLAKHGWGAVPVEGFIPPAAFLDFQARSVLPIACDMRTVEHIAYTPAPDIVHEAAGHAPIIAYKPYSDYLHRYASMAQKAIFSEDDIRLYEAIRYLSDIKENPDTTPAEIEKAETTLKTVSSQIKEPSEAARVARMNWWTVEYGLVGELNQPKIYGAGLLSSVGESQACLSSKVRKIPLTVECVEQSYDITEPQPQLFVARDMEHLVEVLEKFERQLSYVRGGAASLAHAIKARTVTTTVFDSGLQISGCLIECLADGSTVEFIKFGGPVQLAYEGEELPEQGPKRHPQGFSTPLGFWNSFPGKPPHLLSDADLSKAGVEKGRVATLELSTGFTIQGRVLGWTRKKDRLVSLTWDDCKVTRGSQIFYQPEWGEFDMAVGVEILSVFGGPADRQAYGMMDVGKATTKPGRTSPFSSDELSLFEVYSRLRAARDGKQAVESLSTEVLRSHPDEWLLQLELHELGAPKDIEASLLKLARSRPELRELIEKGMALSNSDSKISR